MTRPRLIHLTTTDISLELLLGPQLRAFAAEGYDVWTASAPGPFVASLEADGIRHVALRHATRAMAPHQDVGTLAELVRLFRRLRPDIVHTHNPKPGLYGRLAARAVGVPGIVNTVHGLYALPTDRAAKRLPIYGLERLAASCSHVELVQNPEDVAVLRRLRVPEEKLVVLGNGIDLDRFAGPDATVRREVRRELGLRPDQVVVGAVGRMVWEKGYREFFGALEAVVRRRPDVVLVVVGGADPDKADGITDADLEAIRQRLPVRFLGHRPDVERLYHAFDLYVLASHREGFPRSAMEAAACGLPVLATDIRGCRQVVDHGTTGLLVPPRDQDALALAMGALVDDGDRRAAFASAAVRKARSDFDQSAVIGRTLRAYRSLRGVGGSTEG